MNAITAHNVFSFYPRLTYANESLIFEGQEAIEPLPYSFVLTEINSKWTKACGVYCPMVPRTTYGDPGCAVYPWSYSASQGHNSKWVADTSLVKVGEWGRKYTAATLGWGREPTVVKTEDLRLQELFRWRISSRCYNAHCPNAMLREQRQQYLGRYL